MPIYELRKVDLENPLGSEDLIGNRLCNRSMNHAIQFLGQRAIGLAYNSCNAAVAIEPDNVYDTVAIGGRTFSVVYGSSRLYAGLDPSFNVIHKSAPKRTFSKSQFEEHAEQTAIRVADSQGLAFWRHHGHTHIYVDFEPCDHCEPWLEDQDENWFVHYYASLKRQKLVFDVKKRMRSEEFGRQMEPPLKKMKRS